ncbi:MAG: hypothetical protein KDJ97_00330 [Anaerolineae bacterium]|nr:hypothetical protein [Anaerolineae bacterium]
MTAAESVAVLRNRISWAGFWRVILPAMLIPVVLLMLNWGLHRRLAPQPVTALLTLPHTEAFDATPLAQWFALTGAWQVNGGRLVAPDDAAESSLIVPLQVNADQSYRLDVQLAAPDGGQSAGLYFNLQYPKVRQRSHLARAKSEDGRWVLETGYLDALNNFRSQARTPLAAVPQQLGVEVEAEAYRVLVNGRPLLDGIPLIYQGGWPGLMAAGSGISFDNLRVEPLNPPAPVEPAADAAVEAALPAPGTEPSPTGEVLFKGTFEGDLAASGWLPFAGDWRFENGALLQTDNTGFDLGISYREPFANFLLRATLRHDNGVGGGLIFNLPQPETKNGGHMVRFTDDGAGLFWGFFDAGGEFTGQGFAPTPAPGNLPHLLEVASDSDSYAVWLDGQPIAENVPLLSTAGHVGLTSSQSRVAFPAVEIFSLSGTAPGPTAALDLLAFKTVTGEWVREGDAIRQLNREATDFVTGTGIAAEQYTLSVDIVLPIEPGLADAGGGVIFNMPSREDNRLATMVRLADGGKAVFWGQYDNAGQFSGLGDASLDLPAGQPATLKLTVRRDSFDVQVNGETIATNVPLLGNGGSIGLLSYRGPVTFSNFNLTLGEITP